MQTTIFRILAAIMALATLASCAPVLVGGTAAVIADQVAEDQEGGDGLF
jgi:hypothetical protein